AGLSQGSIITTANSQVLKISYAGGNVTLTAVNTVWFSPATNVAAEGGVATYTVMRAGNSAAPLTVNFSTADGTAVSPTDYNGVTSGSVTIAANQASATFTVGIVDNNVAQASRTFSVTLASGSSIAPVAPTTATTTITNPLLQVTGVTP